MGRRGRRGRRAWLILAGGLLAWVLACRAVPGFAALALDRLARPVMARLHRLTAKLPFPAAEPIALLLGAGLILGLLRGTLAALRRRDRAPLVRRLSTAAWAALLGLGALALLWEPARAIPSDAPPTPEADRLEWLCRELIGALNASALDFPPAAESLRLAPEVSGLPGRAVKFARYPEWMRAAHLSGLFVPLTGEALADAGAPAPLVPFTAVHELMHLDGVADEGAANIAAWERCLDAGGAFADSARLWALRYALGLLGRADPVARLRVQAEMSDALARVYAACGGSAASPGATSSRLPRLLSLSQGDYAALAGYLAGERFSVFSDCSD